jgi:hypothetical protein
MRSSSCSAWLAVFSLSAAAAYAGQVDMQDPRRAVGTEDNIRIDAQLMRDEITAGGAVSVTYQIQNGTPAPIAVADKVSDVSFDPDSRTLVVSIGAEVPASETMPHLVVVPAGEKRVLTGGSGVHMAGINARSPLAVVPRYVQFRVIVLRDVTRFAALIDAQTKTAVQPRLPNDLFDRWVEACDSVLLNPIPVRWRAPSTRGTAADAAGLDEPVMMAGAGGGK